MLLGLDALDQHKVRALEDEIRQLHDSLTAQAKKEKVTEADRQRARRELEELKKKQQLAFLLDRLSPEAATVLLESQTLAAEFLRPEARDLFAMSVDIRRSTELMLKARNPQSFATFITELCNDLMGIVRLNNGVIDKFTGDGILCFFPEFFTGEDAGYYALVAADMCHAAFDKHYRTCRNSFTSILRDVGLGIGIDYGACYLVQVAGGLTIVGSPVVYACRFGGAPAGTTLLNQPAYEMISDRHGASVLVSETSLEIKHEGPVVAYSATLSRNAYQPAPPAWRDPKWTDQKKQAGPPAGEGQAKAPDRPSK